MCGLQSFCCDRSKPAVVPYPTPKRSPFGGGSRGGDLFRGTLCVVGCVMSKIASPAMLTEYLGTPVSRGIVVRQFFTSLEPASRTYT